MHTPAISLQVCICVYIYLSLSLSLSCSPSNRGGANSQARDLDGKACLRGAPIQPLGTPRPRAPQGTLKQSPHLQKWFFLASILQQYRNTLLYTETRGCRSSGTEAVPIPVPAGAAVPAPHCRRPAASQPGAGEQSTGWVAGVPQEPPTAPTTPWLAQGIRAILPVPGVPPGRAGGSGGNVSPLPSPLQPVRAQGSLASGKLFPAEAVLPTMASCC